MQMDSNAVKHVLEERRRLDEKLLLQREEIEQLRNKQGDLEAREAEQRRQIEVQQEKVRARDLYRHGHTLLLRFD